MICDSSAPCLPSLLASSSPTIVWVCSNFFDDDVMSGGPNDIYEEGNEKFVWVVILRRRVSYVI